MPSLTSTSSHTADADTPAPACRPTSDFTSASTARSLPPSSTIRPDGLDPALSSLREKMLETLFLAELSRTLWCRGQHDIEVLRAEIDRAGYDIVVECAGVMRHIQLKSKHHLGKASEVSASLALAAKPSGCILLIEYDPATMEIGPFRWFGGAPGEPLPDLGSRIARHSKGDKNGVKAERPGHRTLPLSRFTRLASMSEVADVLFGERTV